MTNPYEENPQTQPSQQDPYAQPGQQYPQSGGQQTPYGQQSPMPYGQQSPMPYGQQQQPYTMPPTQEHPQGTLILIFGILGIFITIFAPIAWYLGNKAKKDVQTSGIQYSNEQNISVGRMLGKIFTIIAIISIVFVIILWIVIAIAASTSG
ncbi:MAG TPA: hypothetical protein VFB83_00980 [Propionibacteriaceae bacterium]|jgi:hypothetical protein|nr:hypothetical protein [Propionibacteriaceae bacterium]